MSKVRRGAEILDKMFVASLDRFSKMLTFLNFKFFDKFDSDIP